MPVLDEDRMFKRKRPLAGAFILPLVIGLLMLFSVTQSPQFESYRNMDVAKLLVSGAGFGAALVFLMITICRPRI
jgi:hypothetical protein